MNPTSTPSAGIEPVKAISYKRFVRYALALAVTWLWDGFIPMTGIVLLVGPSFVGKSRLIAALFGQMTKGRGALLGRSVKKCRAIYVALEHDPKVIAQTLVAAAKTAGVEALDIRVRRPPFDLLDDAELEALRKDAEEFNASVIVFDSLRRCGSFAENDSGEVAAIMKRLEALTDDGKRLVIAIHHVGKAKEGPRGSTDLEAGSDSVLRIAGTKEGRLTLRATSHSAKTEDVSFRISHDDDGLELELAEVVPTKPEVEQAVVEICSRGKPVGIVAIRDGVRSRKLTASNKAIEVVLIRLQASGQLKSVGKKKWEVA